MFKSLYQNKIAGRKKYQLFFKKLAHFSKYGMNIGSPIAVESSGEVGALHLLKQVFASEKKLIFVDVGANEGCYTKAILDVFDNVPVCEFHLFEPQKKLFDLLLQQFEAKKHFFINNNALGSGEGVMKLYNFENIHTIASLYPLFKGEKQSTDYEEVQILRLDQYITEKDISTIHLLKIDVEGHELEVLRGLGNYLNAGIIKAIQFEFGSFNISSRTYFNDFWLLLNRNYNFYRILVDGLYPILEYSVDLEIFDTTNYLLILKS